METKEDLFTARKWALDFLEVDHDIRVLEDGRVWISGGVTPSTAGTVLDLNGLIDAITPPTRAGGA